MEFTSRFRYAPQEEAYSNDGRELELLNHILNLPEHHIKANLLNNPRAIVAEIDAFATKKYLMNVGEMKGQIITKAIATHRPITIVELGGYVGYSALLFASTPEFLSTANRRYITIEQSPVFASIIAAFVKLAGLDSVVRVVVGQSSTALRELDVDRIDLLFLDHYKPAYTPDLKLCEVRRLVRGGTVLVADNVLKPGNPRYLEYVNMSVEEKIALAEKVGGDHQEGDERMGNPKLIYESRFVESFEPTGIPDAVEITVCVGVEDGD